MPLYMDVHKNIDGLTAEAAAEVHQKDLEKQGEYGVKYLNYWFNESEGTVYCLFDSPDRESGEIVHREAHGMVADEITEVKQGD